ncbi:MAG TPA: penicillin acylase family protein, partial [Phnomibacter sp.]|nr:penicillin acylase family protein [Phnomibacter sp.]
DEEGPTIFTEWWRELAKMVWNDNIQRADPLQVPFPESSTLLEALLRDTAFVFIDDVNTPQVETLSDLVTRSLNLVAKDLQSKPLAWAAFKATGVRHLLGNSMAAFSRLQLPIGGGSNIINATTTTHGPSWRVVVHLTDETEAFGIYPGGQSGNPGSVFYDQFVDKWAKGEYYKLWIMKPTEQEQKKAKWKMTFKPARA